jgi:hypothetical protein
LGGGDSSNSPPAVTAKIFPVSLPAPLSYTERLSSYQVLNIHAEFIKICKYDKNLLYDTAQLISFPSVKLDAGIIAGIQLYDNKEQTINMRITIPQDFPDDLLNKPVFVEVHGKVES